MTERVNMKPMISLKAEVKSEKPAKKGTGFPKLIFDKNEGSAMRVLIPRVVRENIHNEDGSKEYYQGKNSDSEIKSPETEIGYNKKVVYQKTKKWKHTLRYGFQRNGSTIIKTTYLETGIKNNGPDLIKIENRNAGFIPYQGLYSRHNVKTVNIDTTYFKINENGVKAEINKKDFKKLK